MLGPDWTDGKIRTRMRKLSIHGRTYDYGIDSANPYLDRLSWRMPLSWTVKR